MRPGLLPASPEGAATAAPDTSQLRRYIAIAGNPARSVKNEFKERPFSYLRCKPGIGFACSL
jgi:hypothetical protein